MLKRSVFQNISRFIAAATEELTSGGRVQGPIVETEQSSDLIERAARSADEVAGTHAERRSTAKHAFPKRRSRPSAKQGLLSAFLPKELGGQGSHIRGARGRLLQARWSAAERVRTSPPCTTSNCCLVRHAANGPAFPNYLSQVADRAAPDRPRSRRRSASGGDMSRRSPRRARGQTYTFEKQATTVATGRRGRSPDACVAPRTRARRSGLALGQRDQYALEQTGTGDPLGMRGTCAPGSSRRAGSAPTGVAPPFAVISSRRRWCRISHILWASVVARDRDRRVSCAHDPSSAAAGKRSRASRFRRPRFVSPDESSLPLLRAEVGRRSDEFDGGIARAGTRTTAAHDGLGVRYNNLKIAASEPAPRFARRALESCGIVGFKNDTPFSVGRHLRDTMSAP